MPSKDVERMFAHLGDHSIDTSNIRRKFIDCPYGDAPNQVLDVYVPDKGNGPFPIVFFAHGGAWSIGSKSDAQLLPFIDGINRGYAIISMNYRLVPEIRYPENLFDIKTALRWAAKKAEEYMLDPSRVALCGASAGAHLSLMAAFTQGQVVFDNDADAPSCRVLAVVEQFGPTDLAKIHVHFDESGFPRAQVPGEFSPQDALIGVRMEVVPNFMRFVNPLDNVHPNIPPVLIQHGIHDPVIPYQQATELHDKIISVAGVGMAELDLYETFLHADPGYASAESVDRIFEFLDKHLHPATT